MATRINARLRIVERPRIKETTPIIGFTWETSSSHRCRRPPLVHPPLRQPQHTDYVSLFYKNLPIITFKTHHSKCCINFLQCFQVLTCLRKHVRCSKQGNIHLYLTATFGYRCSSFLPSFLSSVRPPFLPSFLELKVHSRC